MSFLDLFDGDRPEELSGGTRIRWIPGYIGRYAVTADGSVWSCERQGRKPDIPWAEVLEIRRRDKEEEPRKSIAKDFPCSYKHICAICNGKRRQRPDGEWRELSPGLTPMGYQTVSLEGASYYVQHLVAAAYLDFDLDAPEAESGCVLHRNDVKTDNRAGNLYIGDREDNYRDAVENGGREVRIDDASALEIRREAARGLRRRQKDIAAEYGISRVYVSGIINNHSHEHLPSVEDLRRKRRAETERAIRTILENQRGAA